MRLCAQSALFVELACHLPVLDGFDPHFQATVHIPLSSALDCHEHHGQFFSSENISGMLGIKPGVAGS